MYLYPKYIYVSQIHSVRLWLQLDIYPYDSKVLTCVRSRENGY